MTNSRLRTSSGKKSRIPRAGWVFCEGIIRNAELSDREIAEFIQLLRATVGSAEFVLVIFEFPFPAGIRVCTRRNFSKTLPVPSPLHRTVRVSLLPEIPSRGISME